jgi:hypothetical protein
MTRPLSISALAQTLYRQQRGPSQSEAPAPVATELPEPYARWPVQKKIALLVVGRGAMAMDCIEHLKAGGAWARQEDFAALRREGLIFKRDVTSRYHELTPAGRRWADNLAWTLACELKLHHIRRASHSDSVSAKCSCGWSRAFARKYFGEDGKLNRAIDAHNADPEAWRRERDKPSVIAALVADAMRKGDGR